LHILTGAATTLASFICQTPITLVTLIAHLLLEMRARLAR